MGHRLSKIYTRTGDSGTTGLSDGTRLDKDDPRVEAMGAVDETNNAIGLVLTETVPQPIRACLIDIQHNLFNVGGELSLPGYSLIADHHVTALEQELDRLNEQLEPLKDFILPGGSRAATYAHMARSICRRAERRLVTLHRTHGVSPQLMRYINRLSDFLFVLARFLNHSAGRPDVLWQQGRDRSGAK